MKKLPVFISLAACILIFATACNVNSNMTNPQQGNFLVTNVSPDAPPLDLYINSTGFIQGLGYGTYSAYNALTAGSYTFSFFDSASASSPVLSNLITLSPATNNSYFVIDSFKRVKASFVPDNLVLPGPDSVNIRFFNFSPNAGAVSLYEATLDSAFYSIRSFNDVSGAAFNKIKAGVYNFQLQQPDGTVLASKLDTLSSGHIYTIFAKGNVSGTSGQEIGIGQILNF